MATTATTPKGGGVGWLLQIARRRRALALLPFLFVLTAAISLALFLPGVWTSRALILVQRPKIAESFVKSSVVSDVEGQLLTLSQDVLSPPRLLSIIKDFNLYPSYRRRHSAEEVVDRMRKDIRLDIPNDERRSRNASVLFSVSYLATNPAVARDVASRLAWLYVQENGKFRTQQAEGTSQFIDTQLREVRERLQAQEKRIADYKERHLGELPEQRDANLRTLESLQQRLQLAYDANRRANERRQSITRSLAQLEQTLGYGAAVTGGPNITPGEAAAARLVVLRQELTQLQSTYSDKYPDVIAMKDQILALEAKVNAEKLQRQAAGTPRVPRDPRDLRVASQNPYMVSLVEQLNQADIDAKTSAEDIASLNRQIAAYQRRVENLPKREQEYAVISRDYETTRELFRSLLAKRGEAEIAADLEQRQKGEQYRIIEHPALPPFPTGPNRLRLLLLGLVLAAGASAIAVVLAEQVDTSFRNVDEIRASLPAPVLSSIPRIATESDRRRLVRQRRLATAGVAIALVLVAGSSFMLAHNNESLVTLLTSTDVGARR